ncbi:MAG TPA: hypothetical protein VIA82_00965 [Candidatus Limnocylindria bacterium]
MNVRLPDRRPAARRAGVGALVVVAILAVACQRAPGAGSPTATPPASQSQAAPAATPTSLGY